MVAARLQLAREQLLQLEREPVDPQLVQEKRCCSRKPCWCSKIGRRCGQQQSTPPHHAVHCFAHTRDRKLAIELSAEISGCGHADVRLAGETSQSWLSFGEDERLCSQDAYLLCF